MRIFFQAIAIMTLVAATSPLPASAQDIRQERLRFDPGETSTEIRDHVSGYESVDYLLRARSGQQLTVALRSPNRDIHFDVLAPGSDEPMFTGSREGSSLDTRLPLSGDYRIRIYLARHAGRPERRGRFNLAVSVSGQQAERPRPPAPGRTRGPEFWEVTGIGGRDYLNVRTGPGTRFPVIARLSDGDVLRNLECRTVNGQRWCNVERQRGGDKGWVAADYLRETNVRPRPDAPSRPAPEPETGGHGPDFWEVTGVGRWDHLNVRTGPSTRYPVIAGISDGDVLRNLGCRTVYRQRWCHIELPRGAGDGWVSADYLSETRVAPRPGRPAPPAPGTDGHGPDFWEVTGIGGRDYLNVRSGPGTRNPVIARLSDGEVMRNLGCRMVDGQRWCKIERPRGGDTGWAAGAFLRETGPAPRPGRPERPRPLPGRSGNGEPFSETGSLPCSGSTGQPSPSCRFGVIRDAIPGNASLWIDLGSDERFIRFERGRPVYTNATGHMLMYGNGDTNLIRIGNERYEVPQEVIYGN